MCEFKSAGDRSPLILPVQLVLMQWGTLHGVPANKTPLFLRCSLLSWLFHDIPPNHFQRLCSSFAAGLARVCTESNVQHFKWADSAVLPFPHSFPCGLSLLNLNEVCFAAHSALSHLGA